MKIFENIVSIKYDKISGEYTIKTRDPNTGKPHRTHANRPNAAEINFIKLAHKYENNDSITWTK